MYSLEKYFSRVSDFSLNVSENISQASSSAIPSASSKGDFSLMAFAPFIAIFFIFYFLLIRPQQKQQKKMAEMISNLKVGEHVITSAGLLGRIVEIDKEGGIFFVELSDGVVVRMLKNSVVDKVTKDSKVASEEKKEKKGKKSKKDSSENENGKAKKKKGLDDKDNKK